MSSTVGVSLKFEDSLDLDLTGIPDNFDLALTGIPNAFSLDVKSLPKIEIAPLTVSLAITEIPSIRTHIPSNYTVGLSVLGYELVSLRLCGETQLITEPYRPNPCEICGRPHGEPKIPTYAGTVVEQPK